ncbi:MAG: tRNA (adenosine(37)-N6)-threonylcarbamoyltransferase complex dimerization subunit type 1 TsaB [Phycisphaeraceae bacterium]|nr:tRNA (adenosine(37)-N6)-threonylcarbamoyltransferase complex dimerization subunit type 1 TsaB [Phycisphaeraceae bacterium]MCW5763686.1 tRNA (adenosine(37)-N6)-threonylcarbamoyltransferase complex dimerization subunit type 1 TsaB [Phycisphaeraceae bacterium]
MLILGIETSNPSSGTDRPAAGVALVRTEESLVEVLGVEWLRATGRHDDDLMPAIDRLCAAASVAPAELGRIGVSIGPGGYTGLRVACTTAMMIAEACGGECVGIPTALVQFATRAQQKQELSARVAVVLAVKGVRMYVHFAGEPTGVVMSSEELLACKPTEVIADQFLPPMVREWASAAGVPISPPTCDPVAVAVLAANGAPADVVLPLYAREPEAVTRWRETRSK